jgi:hypothetical protein
MFASRELIRYLASRLSRSIVVGYSRAGLVK